MTWIRALNLRRGSPEFLSNHSTRGKGIGSELVRRIEIGARSLGVSTLYLYTPHTESLYERLGWSVTERCEYRNTNVVVMSKELARV